MPTLVTIVICALTAVAVSGCSSNYTPPPASDLSIARSALEKSLDCWRLRIAPSDLRSATPAITVQDEDWAAEHRLLDYKILPGEAAAGPTIRWPVHLHLVRQNGQEEQVDVMYVISTNPIVHISRQD